MRQMSTWFQTQDNGGTGSILALASVDTRQDPTLLVPLSTDEPTQRMRTAACILWLVDAAALARPESQLGPIPRHPRVSPQRRLK